MAVVHASKENVQFKPVYMYREQASERQRVTAGQRNIPTWTEKGRDSEEAAEWPVI